MIVTRFIVLIGLVSIVYCLQCQYVADAESYCNVTCTDNNGRHHAARVCQIAHLQSTRMYNVRSGFDGRNTMTVCIVHYFVPAQSSIAGCMTTLRGIRTRPHRCLHIDVCVLKRGLDGLGSIVTSLPPGSVFQRSTRSASFAIIADSFRPYIISLSLSLALDNQ